MTAEPFFLRKMAHHAEGGELVYYLGTHQISESLGKTVTITHTGKKNCIACDRSIKKTFNQGYCYPCLRSLARCDSCIVKPEKCHFHEGTCREPEWGEEHCLIDHVVYLANTTGLKVGVTGAHKVLERWGDQGALAALVLARVPERLVAGRIEVALKELVSDKTNWRHLLTGKGEEVDLLQAYRELKTALEPELQQYLLSEEEAASSLTEMSYPVHEYLAKASTWNLDKLPEITGVLQGVRGQYLFIGGKGVNIRKYQGYEVTLSIVN